jgi:FixJ family two-component response regulator
MPVVFITGYGDIPMSVKAMKQGAINFLSKPVDDKDLLNAVKEALQADWKMRLRYEERTEIQDRLKSLTQREFQVLRFVLAGLLNKQIAFDLGITEKTVKVHRAQVMQKMKASTVAELARIAGKAGVEPATAEEG